jgi:hypothetical protein
MRVEGLSLLFMKGALESYCWRNWVNIALEGTANTVVRASHYSQKNRRGPFHNEREIEEGLVPKDR